VAVREVRGWRKELSDNPCDWCQSVADEGATYGDAEDVPSHNSDQCSVAPVFESEE
jgi:hypothetical protein